MRDGTIDLEHPLVLVGSEHLKNPSFRLTIAQQREYLREDTLLHNYSL